MTETPEQAMDAPATSPSEKATGRQYAAGIADGRLLETLEKLGRRMSREELARLRENAVELLQSKKIKNDPGRKRMVLTTIDKLAELIADEPDNSALKA